MEAHIASSLESSPLGQSITEVADEVGSSLSESIWEQHVAGPNTDEWYTQSALQIEMITFAVEKLLSSEALEPLVRAIMTQHPTLIVSECTDMVKTALALQLRIPSIPLPLSKKISEIVILIHRTLPLPHAEETSTISLEQFHLEITTRVHRLESAFAALDQKIQTLIADTKRLQAELDSIPKNTNGRERGVLLIDELSGYQTDIRSAEWERDELIHSNFRPIMTHDNLQMVVDQLRQKRPDLAGPELLESVLLELQQLLGDCLHGALLRSHIRNTIRELPTYYNA